MGRASVGRARQQGGLGGQAALKGRGEARAARKRGPAFKAVSRGLPRAKGGVRGGTHGCIAAQIGSRLGAGRIWGAGPHGVPRCARPRARSRSAGILAARTPRRRARRGGSRCRGARRCRRRGSGRGAGSSGARPGAGIRAGGEGAPLRQRGPRRSVLHARGGRACDVEGSRSARCPPTAPRGPAEPRRAGLSRAKLTQPLCCSDLPPRLRGAERQFHGMDPAASSALSRLRAVGERCCPAVWPAIMGPRPRPPRVSQNP
jgi:hypothetical protein